MNSDLKTINSTGFYFYADTHWIVQDKTESAFIAYFNSTRRRLFSPGIAPEAIVVRYYGYKGLYNDIEYLESQYVYYSIYDAMRQVFAYKEGEYEGRIELLAYTDESGLELLREWQFEVEGFTNMDGDTEIEFAGWEKSA
jgi:hypothetical protein